jgi:hypothetical protein
MQKLQDEPQKDFSWPDTVRQKEEKNSWQEIEKESRRDWRYFVHEHK